MREARSAGLQSQRHHVPVADQQPAGDPQGVLRL